MNIEGKLSIDVRLGDAGGNQVRVASSRPLQATRMLEGKEMGETLKLLPLIFNVCGQAQVCAGVRACESRLGRPASPELEARRESLVAVETLREHLWRVFLDWPPQVGQAADQAPLSAMLRIQREAALALFPEGRLAAEAASDFIPDEAKLETLGQEIAGLLEARVFGMAPARWLEMETRRQLESWMGQTPTVAARYLGQLWSRDWQALGGNDIEPLPFSVEDRLRERMNDPEFIRAPTWNGRCRETSVFTRTDSALLEELRSGWGNGLAVRIVARLVEIARLAGALKTGGKQAAVAGGQGQVQAARGLLLHDVELDEARRITRYRILAPTEWNFHENGVVARSLATLTGDVVSVTEQAHQLIRAIDPCVGYELRVFPAGSADN